MRVARVEPHYVIPSIEVKKIFHQLESGLVTTLVIPGSNPTNEGNALLAVPGSEAH